MRVVRVLALGIGCALGLAALGCNTLVGLDDFKKVECVGAGCVPDAAVDAALDAAPIGVDVGSDAAVEPPGTCEASPSPKTAAANCSPADFREKTCTPAPANNGSACPVGGSSCAALTKNDVGGSIFNLRISHMKFWYPPVLDAVAGDLVHDQTNTKCVGGKEVLNILLQFDSTQRKLKVGSARPSTDGVTFSFLNETFPSKKFADACPGATRVPLAALEIKPFSVPFTLAGPNISTEVLPRLFIASFDTDLGVPSIVPIVDVSLSKITIKPDRNCVGEFVPEYACAGNPSRGWRTGGLIVGKIPLEEADDIPVPIGGCQSLCAVLANDPERVDSGHCKRVGGKVVEFGDTCVGGSGCKNAVWFSAAFAAHAVKIE